MQDLCFCNAWLWLYQSSKLMKTGVPNYRYQSIDPCASPPLYRPLCLLSRSSYLHLSSHRQAIAPNMHERYNCGCTRWLECSEPFARRDPPTRQFVECMGQAPMLDVFSIEWDKHLVWAGSNERYCRMIEWSMKKEGGSATVGVSATAWSLIPYSTASQSTSDRPGFPIT